MFQCLRNPIPLLVCHAASLVSHIFCASPEKHWLLIGI
jgi:hypothetical protein